jgi:hypothetical protein
MSIPTLSTLFGRERKPQVLWARPEDSVGRQCEWLRVKGIKCYEAVGPACDAFKELKEALEKLLLDHKEDLEREIKKCSGVGFGLFMVGSEPSQTTPTIIISSLNKRQRRSVKNLIEDEVRTKLPAFQIKTLCEPPAVLTGDTSPEPMLHSVLASSLMSQFREDTHGFVTTKISCGAAIRYGDALATLGGIISITKNGESGLYATTTGHLAQFNQRNLEGFSTSNRELVFDDDSDDEDLDEPFMEEELMSKGSFRVPLGN